MCRIKPTCISTLFDLGCWPSGSSCQISVSNPGRHLSQIVASVSDCTQTAAICPPGVMILYTNSHQQRHSVLPFEKTYHLFHAVPYRHQILHVFLIIIIVFVLVLRKCPFCMLDQPVEKSNIMEVQGELHPGPCISLPPAPFHHCSSL